MQRRNTHEGGTGGKDGRATEPGMTGSPQMNVGHWRGPGSIGTSQDKCQESSTGRYIPKGAGVKAPQRDRGESRTLLGNHTRVERREVFTVFREKTQPRILCPVKLPSK